MLNFKSTNLSALWPKAGMIFSKITKPVYKRWSTLSKGLMLLGLIFVVGLGLFSCKKEFNLQSNFQNEGSSLQKFKKFDWNVTEQSFFSLEDRFNSFKGVGDRTDNNKFIFKPLLVEAYNQIAEENNAQHFITNIANSAGFPIWNKSLVYKDSIGHNDLVIIPLSKTGFKIVSSYIMLYRNPTISSNRFNISSVTRSEVLDTAGVNASIKASQARWLLALDKHVFNLEDENLKSSYCEYLNNSNAGANGPAPNPPITPCQWQQFEICFTPGSSTFWIGGNSVLPPHLDHDHDGIPNQYDNDWNLLVNSGRITQDDFTRMVNEWWYDKYYDDFGSYNVFFDQFNDIQGGEPVNIDWDPLSYKLDDIMFHFDQFFGNILDDFRDGWYDLWHEVHCFDWGPVNGSATDREVICRYAWVYVCNDGTDNWWNNLINDLYGWEAPQDERDYIYQYWLSNNLGSYGIEFNDIANIVLQYCHEYGPGYEQCADEALLNFIQGYVNLTPSQINILSDDSNRVLLAQIANFVYLNKSSNLVDDISIQLVNIAGMLDKPTYSKIVGSSLGLIKKEGSSIEIQAYVLNHLNDLVNDSEYREMYIASFVWPPIIWVIAKELISDKAIDILLNIIPGFNKKDEVADAIKAITHGDPVEFAVEVGKILVGQAPLIKALDVANNLRQLYKVIDKINDLVSQIGTQRLERAWDILKGGVSKFSDKALKYVDDLSFPKLGWVNPPNVTLYRQRFMDAFPELNFISADQVHHALPQAIQVKYPNLNVTDNQMHSLENLRGIKSGTMIPNNSMPLHTYLTNQWKIFYDSNPQATLQQILDQVKLFDDQFGPLFVPPIR
ncbi:MAG: hypothetical protein NW218_10560 [Saprospiraceae bacterium]|nr:hypothetical protein [Saprospiraceae bacterium]